MFLLSREGLSLGRLIGGPGLGHLQGRTILAGGSLDECCLVVGGHGFNVAMFFVGSEVMISIRHGLAPASLMFRRYGVFIYAVQWPMVRKEARKP